MRKWSVLLLSLMVSLSACNKDENDDDDNNNNNDPNNQEASFSMSSADGSLDVEGTAALIPNFGIDSVQVISFNGSNQTSATLSLFNRAGAWNANEFNLNPSVGTNDAIFSLVVSDGGSQPTYISMSGQVRITDKSEDQYMEGDFDVAFLRSGTGDTIQATGEFFAK